MKTNAKEKQLLEATLNMEAFFETLVVDPVMIVEARPRARTMHRKMKQGSTEAIVVLFIIEKMVPLQLILLLTL